jgi:hypothetical protein
METLPITESCVVVRSEPSKVKLEEPVGLLEPSLYTTWFAEPATGPVKP